MVSSCLIEGSWANYEKWNTLGLPVISVMRLVSAAPCIFSASWRNRSIYSCMAVIINIPMYTDSGISGKWRELIAELISENERYREGLHLTGL